MLVLPADHLIRPRSAFVKAAKHAATLAARKKRLVVFGIEPTRPDTGYGYIEQGKLIDRKQNVASHDVRRFVEKPNAQRARAYCRSKRYLWNSGMFVWRTDVILEEFARHMPRLHHQAMQAVRQRFTQRAIDTFYGQCEKQSIDYGIMERSEKVAAVRGAFSWDDIGSWEAIARVHKTNANGTAVVGSSVCAEDADGSIIVNDSSRAVAAIGVRDLVVVTTDDAVLVIPRDRLAGIKDYLSEMKQRSDFPSSLF
jgi:mannose-1-phosphate guanylyltransferase